MSDTSSGDRIARLTLEERSALESRLMENRRHAPRETILRLGCAQSHLPLSFAQERMWFLEQLHPGTPLYNIPWAVRLAGALDVGVLRRSLDALGERHATLRTTYHETDGVPYQVVCKSSSLPFNSVDLRGVSNGEEKLQQLLSEEARRPFDLTSDYMLRATVVQLSDLEHVLLLVAHHIAVDGWSRQIINQELGVIYEDSLRGRKSRLPDLPIEYTDYAAWQRDETRDNELDRELAYWRTNLEGLPPTLDLPTSSSQPIDEPFAGGKIPISIPEGLVVGVRQLATELNVTPFMIIVAAVMVTLHRYTGETDIAIGTPIDGRTSLETESLVGLFVNTLVLRGDVSGQPSFAKVVQRVKSVCVEAYGHQEVPFERIVADLAAERTQDRSPLVQVMLAYRNISSESMSLAGTNATAIKIGTDTSRFDLSFSLSETSAGFAGALVYSRRLFSEIRMRALAAHFVRLLEAGVDGSEQAIGKIPMLSAKERKKILVDWNAVTTPKPEETTIYRLFERAATAAPHTAAVVCGEDRLTYGDLNDRADHVAAYLRRLDVQPGELVGISMHRSTDLIVGLLGILKAGAAYLPLDPHFPPDRLRLMVEDATIRAILTQSDVDICLPTDEIQTLRMDDDWPAIARLEPAASIDSQPEQLAYVMYTSGSTGRPKGVMITHRNVVGFLNAFRHVVDASPRRISTNVITYAFDISVEEIFSPLCYGGLLHIVPDETTLDGRSLAHYILDHEINTAYIVPDLLPSVAETFEKHGGCGDLACLRTGLAPKRESVLQRFREISPSLKIINAYGPTEVTYGATAYEFGLTTDPERDVPIGRPFPDYQIYIVNDMLEPVPIGVTGEILIGGVGVSLGYLNRPDLTAERFIPSPFSGPPDRLFRTGDLGRYLDDGNIEFLGRTDRQVKIRGYRIELREIELALESHPLVTFCNASTKALAEDDVRLIAYVVCAGGQQTIENALRQHLQRQLPGYMIPSAFVFLDDFPLLPTGKIDRRALPQPEWSRAGSADRYVLPTSETERGIAVIWGEILKLDRVGIYDSFFELGGHSLLAVRVISRIKRSLGASVSVAQFFERPTVAGLAALIESQQRAGEDPFLLHVKTGGTKRPFFCMADTEYMYAMAEALGSDQPFYGLRIPGLGQDETPLDTIEAMASYCVEAIETIDVDGPYLIGGHCFGATVALEVAQQMSRNGKRVDVLALLAPDNLTGSKRRIIRFWMHRLRHNIERRRVTEALGNRWRSFSSFLASLLDREQYNKSKRYFEARRKARTQYHLSFYAGRILYVWYSERAAPPSAYRNYVLGSQPWLEVSNGGMRRVVIEGTHTGIFRQPGLSQLVEQLKSEFAATERDTRSP